MQVELSNIVYDAQIYPRDKYDPHTVKVYADALKAGAKFPPIILESDPIKPESNKHRIIDGVHRWKAYQSYLAEYKECQENREVPEGWAIPKTAIEVIWHTIPENIPPKLYAAQFSCEHGDRIKPAERKAIAREVYEANPDFTLEVLRQHLKVSLGTAHGYVSDLLALRKEEKKMTVYRLNLLGWTSEEVGSTIGYAESTIRTMVSDEKSSEFSGLKKLTKNLLFSGLPHAEVAKRQNMPLILVWAIDLAGRTDQQRMEKLGIKVQPYDFWNFGKCHDLFGSAYPGRIPGQLVAHVLYHYSDPGAMIVDPMAGSGTTIDVCLAMGRKCYAFDMAPKRLDIIEHDLKDGWHNRVKKADLIFWDPPYFSKKDEGYVDGSISGLDRQEYLSFFSERLLEAHALVKQGTRLAFLMSDWNDEETETGIFLWDYADIIHASGWELIRQTQVPLSTQSVHPDIVEKFRAAKRQARLARYLLLAKA